MAPPTKGRDVCLLAGSDTRFMQGFVSESVLIGVQSRSFLWVDFSEWGRRGASISGRKNFTQACGEPEPACHRATDSSGMRRTTSCGGTPSTPGTPQSHLATYRAGPRSLFETRSPARCGLANQNGLVRRGIAGDAQNAGRFARLCAKRNGNPPLGEEFVIAPDAVTSVLLWMRLGETRDPRSATEPRCGVALLGRPHPGGNRIRLGSLSQNGEWAVAKA